MTSPHPAPAPRSGRGRPRPAPVPDPPLSVWVTAQQDARTQRRGRYLPESMAHPAKMLPAIAATAIERYTQPGDLVADPMCGIGTTLVEAIHLGRGILERDIEKTVPDPDTECILYCGGGFRSALVAEIAQRMGYKHVASLIGGYKALTAAGWRTTT